MAKVLGTSKTKLLNCLQLRCSMLQPSCHPNSTFFMCRFFGTVTVQCAQWLCNVHSDCAMCTVTVHQSFVESVLEKGWSNTTNFLGLSACQLQAVEQVFLAVVSFYLGFTFSNMCISHFQQYLWPFWCYLTLRKLLLGLFPITVCVLFALKQSD